MVKYKNIVIFLIEGLAPAFMTSFRVIMVFVGGRLADIQWNYAFYVHLLAILSLILVTIIVPNTKPKKDITIGIVEKWRFTGVT